jgi:6-phosphogluconolactonase/glucosamine-6-phosphate isomerase/deaminase
VTSIADFHQIISQKHLVLELKDPFVVTVSDQNEGFFLAKDILYAVTNRKTVLFLSGGATPKDFYTMLSQEEKLDVALVDERYGEKMHENSNEQMLQQSGLLGYLRYTKTPFYPVLQKEPGIEETAKQYDETLRFLFNGFQKSVGILGIGLDGHTAGIPVNHEETPKEKGLLATTFYDFPPPHIYRISMTFHGLSMIDLLIVLVFGDGKKEALEHMFTSGFEKEIPARFFKRLEMATKTLIITDQKL